MLLWGCISKVPLKHPWVQWLARNTLITKRSHDFEHHSLLQWKIQTTVNKRKGTQGKVQGRWAGATVILQQAGSQHLTSLRNNVWQHACSIAHQGRSPNSWCPYIFSWGLVIWLWLNTHMADLTLQPLQRSGWSGWYCVCVCVPVCVCVCVITQSCPTLCHPMDCNPPGSSVHGILQARILEGTAILFSRGSSQPRDWTWVSRIAGRFFTIWATRETPTLILCSSNSDHKSHVSIDYLA